DLRDFENRSPVEAVGLAELLLRYGERNECEDENDGVAKQVLQLKLHAVDREGNTRLPNAGHEDRRDNAEKQGNVYEAANAHTRVRRRVNNGRLRAVASVEIGVQQEERAEDDCRDESGHRQHVRGGPKEIHAAQEAEEQRGITERGQRAADIRDE